jgi:hypothetical protein
MRFSSGTPNGTTLNNSSFILEVVMGSSVSSAFKVSYTARATANSGTPTDTWEYSLNSGSSWNPLGADTIGTTFATFGQTTPALTIGAGSSIWFRDILTGATTKNGTADFNNIAVEQLTPVPEPINVALGVFGGFFGMAVLTRSRALKDRIQRWRVAAVQWIDAV